MPPGVALGSTDRRDAPKKGHRVGRAKSEKLRLVFKDPIQKANSFAHVALASLLSVENACPPNSNGSIPRTPSPEDKRTRDMSDISVDSQLEIPGSTTPTRMTESSYEGKVDQEDLGERKAWYGQKSGLEDATDGFLDETGACTAIVSPNLSKEVHERAGDYTYILGATPGQQETGINGEKETPHRDRVGRTGLCDEMEENALQRFTRATKQPCKSTKYAKAPATASGEQIGGTSQHEKEKAVVKTTNRKGTGEQAEDGHSMSPTELRKGDKLGPQEEKRGALKVGKIMICMLTAWIILALGLGVAGGIFFLLCGQLQMQEFMRTREFSPILPMLGQGPVQSVIAVGVLQQLGAGNQRNREAMVEFGIVPPLVTMLRKTGGAMPQEEHQAAASMLHFLCIGIPKNSEAVLASGGIPALVELVQKGLATKAAQPAAEALAALLANTDSVYGESVLAADGVEALVSLLEGGPDAPATTSATWALANFAGTNTTAQDTIRTSDGLERLVRLAWAGPEEPASHAALLALGNLVVGNPDNQEAVREASGVEAAVKFLESSIERGAGENADDLIDADMIEKVLLASKENALIRSAIREVGGAEQLIQLVLPEECGKRSFWDPNIHALVMVDKGHENATSDAIKRMQRLLEVLQEDGGHTYSGRQSFLSRLRHRNQHLHGTTRVVQDADPLPQQQLAERAAWAIGNMAIGSIECQNAIRKAGGIELLVKMLEMAATNPSGTKSAAVALTALISGNKENRLAIRRTAAVENLIRILGTQSSKELMDAAARVLKVMAQEGMFESDGSIGALQEWAAKWLADSVNANIVAVLSVSVAVPLGCLMVILVIKRLMQHRNVERK